MISCIRIISGTRGSFTSVRWILVAKRYQRVTSILSVPLMLVQPSCWIRDLRNRNGGLLACYKHCSKDGLSSPWRHCMLPVSMSTDSRWCSGQSWVQQFCLLHIISCRSQHLFIQTRGWNHSIHMTLFSFNLPSSRFPPKATPITTIMSRFPSPLSWSFPHPHVLSFSQQPCPLPYQTKRNPFLSLSTPRLMTWILPSIPPLFLKPQ